MHAVIQRCRVSPDQVGEFVGLMEKLVAEPLACQLGFVEYDAVHTPDEGVMTIFVFETRDQARRMEHLAADFARNVRAALSARQVWQVEGEVVVHHHEPSPLEVSA